MLAEELKAEADAFVASFANERLDDGRQRIVRHGSGPERQIQTGIGALDVQRPKVRDRLANADPAAKARFTSNILPKWARRCQPGCAVTGSVFEGHLNRRFRGAAVSYSGDRRAQLVAQRSVGLTAGWQAEYDAWTGRDLSARNYVYI
jgi:hypothetical protein